MADCIDCGKEIPQTPDGVTICQACVEKRLDQLEKEGKWGVMYASAKLGATHIDDLVNGVKRPKGELRKLYEGYLLEVKDAKNTD